jgi:hypothetical protein
MKILAGADIHGSQYRLNIILKNAEKYKPDLVVICGDITQFGPGEVAKNFLNQIPFSTLAIPGNIDTPDVCDAIEESKAINIYKKEVIKNGIRFVGTPDIKEKGLVIVSHVPPRGFQDRVFFGLHAGSKELRRAIERYSPRLVLCGHIHEDPGYTKFRETVIVNCSLGKKGGGALIELKEKVVVRMLD